MKTLNPKAENTVYTQYCIFCKFSSHVRRRGILNVPVRANHGVCAHSYIDGVIHQIITRLFQLVAIATVRFLYIYIHS